MRPETFDSIKAAQRTLAPLLGDTADIAIILGSGLGRFPELLEHRTSISYSQIDSFPVSTVHGHAGEIIAGELHCKRVLAFRGRFHYYEGYTSDEVAAPVIMAGAFGVKTLIVSNAAGGINPDFSVGDIMLISDHINATGTNPLIGPNDERNGPRFPDMSDAYSRVLRSIAAEAAREREIDLREGVYIGLSGPSYETAAEIRAYGVMGADAVGMSTVAEIIVARYLGINCIGLSCITNMATGVAATSHSHAAVLSAAESASDRFERIVSGIIEKI